VSIPPTQDLIKDAFSADPSILDKNLAVQFLKLIHQPLLAIAHFISPMVVIVDALDACEDRSCEARRDYHCSSSGSAQFFPDLMWMVMWDSRRKWYGAPFYVFPLASSFC
jgi:hypothetical protein